MSNVVLKIGGLTEHCGGVHALVDATFELREGEHIAIVGDNGAGKSTFMRQIAGEESRTSGQARSGGEEVHFKRPPEAREAGMEGVVQTLALADDLDVPSKLFLGREIIHFDLGPFSIVEWRAMRRAIDEGLKRTRVRIPRRDNTIRHISGGQRRCVAIARSATFAPKLIIMDEPTAALGAHETAQVENIVRTLKDQGMPLILISHQLRQVFDLVDRIVVFRRGRVAATLDKGETDGNDLVPYITDVKSQSADGALM